MEEEGWEEEPSPWAWASKLRLLQQQLKWLQERQPAGVVVAHVSLHAAASSRNRDSGKGNVVWMGWCWFLSPHPSSRYLARHVEEVRALQLHPVVLERAAGPALSHCWELGLLPFLTCLVD